MMELRHKYKLRLLIDESISFGSLGDTGRGITEHYNIPVRTFTILRVINVYEYFENYIFCSRWMMLTW